MNHAVSRNLGERKYLPSITFFKNKHAFLSLSLSLSFQHSNYHKRHNDIFLSEKANAPESVKHCCRQEYSKYVSSAFTIINSVVGRTFVRRRIISVTNSEQLWPRVLGFLAGSEHFYYWEVKWLVPKLETRVQSRFKRSTCLVFKYTVTKFDSSFFFLFKKQRYTTIFSFWIPRSRYRGIIFCA